MSILDGADDNDDYWLMKDLDKWLGKREGADFSIKSETHRAFPEHEITYSENLKVCNFLCKSIISLFS